MNLSRVRTKPAPADLLVAAAIVILAVLCGLRFWLPQGQSVPKKMRSGPNRPTMRVNCARPIMCSSSGR